MGTSGTFNVRRRSNAAAMARLGVSLAPDGRADDPYRCVRSGNGTTLYTIGYERRTGEDLVSLLIDANVRCLADIRQKPTSRKPDFNEAALRARCTDAGIAYTLWTELGSTEHQRDRLRETGDMAVFRNRFRAHVRRHKGHALTRLAKLVRSEPTALLCYERQHEECHRAVVADLVAEALNATVIAL